MALQVFGCPECSEPFQVDETMAGQAVGCPACGAAVSIPSVEELASSDQPVEMEPAAAPEPTPVQCPHCQGSFGVSVGMFGQQVACPHCDATVEIRDAAQEVEPPETISDPVEASATPPIDLATPAKPKSKSKPKPNRKRKLDSEQGREPWQQTSRVASKSPDEPGETPPAPASPAEPPAESPPEPETFQPQPIAQWMPPPFAVPDPLRFPSRAGGEVILPDGSGGLQQASSRIVTITHNGQEYQLIAMTPAQRQRRKLIHNVVALAIGAALLLMALQLLN